MEDRGVLREVPVSKFNYDSLNFELAHSYICGLDPIPNEQYRYGDLPNKKIFENNENNDAEKAWRINAGYYDYELNKKNINEINKMNSDNFKLAVVYINKNSSYGHSREMKISNSKGNVVFRTEQVPFPDCCGICILKNYGIDQYLTRVEFSEVFNMILDHLRVEDGYSKILLYSTDGSTIIKQLSKFDGAVMTASFKNKRSNNILVGFEIDIIKNDKMVIDEEEDEEDRLEFFDEDVDENDNSEYQKREDDDEDFYIPIPGADVPLAIANILSRESLGGKSVIMPFTHVYSDSNNPEFAKKYPHLFTNGIRNNFNQ